MSILDLQGLERAGIIPRQDVPLDLSAVKFDPPGPGYHLTKIARGEFGEVSKIVEEAAELADADRQGVKIMALVELSDLIGAIDGYLARHHPSVTFDDLKAMSHVTQRAFSNGHR